MCIIGIANPRTSSTLAFAACVTDARRTHTLFGRRLFRSWASWDHEATLQTIDFSTMFVLPLPSDGGPGVLVLESDVGVE